MAARCYELHCDNWSIGLISASDCTKVFKAPPCLTTAPSTEATIQLKPMLICWRVAVRSLAAVEIAISDPVATHCFSWLVVEMSKTAEGTAVLARGDLFDG